MWSNSPAARKSRTTVGPPPMRTSCPPAASRAASSASAGAAPRKGKGVPPSIPSGGRGVEEVEGRATLHLERGSRAVGQHEGRRVKRGVRSPPPLPVGVVGPARWAELARPHDLGADPRLVLLGKRVVDAGGAPRASQDRGTEAGGDHPLVQPMAGVTEGRVECLALAGRETIQRYGEVVNAGPCHLLAPNARLLSADGDFRRGRNSSVPCTSSQPGSCHAA